MDSEKSEINWQLICRICLQNSNSDMKHIFGDTSLPNEEDIVEKIIKCGGVPVQIEDRMPDRICNQCVIDLEVAFNFRNTCQASYYQMLKFIKSREQAKEVKVEVDVDADAETEQDFIKEEAIIYESAFSPETETNEFHETLDNGFSPEDLLPIAETKQTPEEVTIDPTDDEKVQVENIKETKHKSKSRSKREKKNGVRGRKPHPINKFICHICGNMYDMQSRLSQHIKRHTEEKEHECEICGKKFSSAAQIPRHMNTHTGNRPYKCKFCTSSFADSSTRNKHERIHTNERPFKCQECGKCFAYTNVLKVHMSIHTGERPYSCSVCDKRFSQRHHQQSHERTHYNFNGRNAKIQ
ncbi:zinc finger protein interacting with ribonucleoprotein K [Eupeodes corollae]|uniref:zinc finger protein interacting with ribonucleoprotein K n=1 Tax=Eupeodes corollae TaxID=290404 RepID=UPI002492D998|nr:zinc finger protein interacting with ribonucleoprotein K [Eupeodes corollae]